MKKDLIVIYALIAFMGAVFGIGVVYVVTEDALLTGIIAVILLVGDSIAFSIIRKKLNAVPDVQDAVGHKQQKQSEEL